VQLPKASTDLVPDNCVAVLVAQPGYGNTYRQTLIFPVQGTDEQGRRRGLRVCVTVVSLGGLTVKSSATRHLDPVRWASCTAISHNSYAGNHHIVLRPCRADANAHQYPHSHPKSLRPLKQLPPPEQSLAINHGFLLVSRADLDVFVPRKRLHIYITLVCMPNFCLGSQVRNIYSYKSYELYMKTAFPVSQR